jgi:hypothetical protein
MTQLFTVTKPSWFAAEWKVKQKGKIVGSLRMLKKLSYMLAEAKVQKKTYHMGYRGISTRNLFLRDSSGADVASFTALSLWKSDLLVTLDGRQYLWKQLNWWGTRYGFFTTDGSEVMRFHQKALNRQSVATIETQEESLTENHTLLMLFGLYYMKLREMEIMTAVGVIVAAGVAVS